MHPNIEKHSDFLSAIALRFLELNADEIKHSRIALRYFQGESMEEIAITENRSVTRIRQQLAEVKRNMEKQVALADIARFRLCASYLEQTMGKYRTANSPDTHPTLYPTPLSTLSLSTRSANTLASARINSVEKLVSSGPKSLLRKRGVGRTLINELENALNKIGMDWKEE